VNDTSLLKQQFLITQSLVTEGERLINSQVRKIAEMELVGEPTADEEFSLDVMIKIQSSHVVYLKKLEEKLAAIDDD
jgi:hypothetical protein